MYNADIPKGRQSSIWKSEWPSVHTPWPYWWALGKTSRMLVTFYGCPLYESSCGRGDVSLIYPSNRWITLEETLYFQITLLRQSRFSWLTSIEWRFDINRRGPAWGRRKGNCFLEGVCSVIFKHFIYLGRSSLTCGVQIPRTRSSGANAACSLSKAASKTVFWPCWETVNPLETQPICDKAYFLRTESISLTDWESFLLTTLKMTKITLSGCISLWWYRME